MFSFLFAAAVSAGSTTSCTVHLERGETVVEKRSLKVRDGTLEAVAVAKSNAIADMHADTGARMVVLGRACKILFEQQFPDAAKALFSEERLGGQPMLFVTAFEPGASGSGFRHMLLAYGGEMFADDGVQSLAPMDLTHGNMDGIFVGNRGHGLGPGLVMWTALWRGLESHYEPHLYEIVSYAWRDGRFVGPVVRTTKRKIDPGNSDNVARQIGLPFRDMTQQKRFGWP